MSDDKWISVKDRLPDSNVGVLIVHGSTPVRQIANYMQHRWYVNGYEVTFVTHWQPLPEPPKQESSFERWWKWYVEPCNAWNRSITIAKDAWNAAVEATKKPDFVP